MTTGPRITVLGAAAGGGSPQWNCNCPVCRRVRAGEPGAPRRTQTSLALSADGNRFALINASPDLGEQLLRTPSLHPQRDGRHSPIDAVVLTGGEIDEVTGLLTMREGESFALYASQTTHDTLAASPIFGALDQELVPRRRLPMNETIGLSDGSDKPLDIAVEAFPVPGKIPLYQEDPGVTPEIGALTDANIALQLSVGDSRAFFIPGCADITEELRQRIDGASILFFDGTLWSDDELISAGLGHKTGHRMGHVSIDGAEGAIAELADIDVERKIFIHLNNSNPVLLDDSDERRAVEDRGWEVAYDGMEISL